jgi:uncharacterized protein with beta-barrel porin domain
VFGNVASVAFYINEVLEEDSALVSIVDIINTLSESEATQALSQISGSINSSSTYAAALGAFANFQASSMRLALQRRSGTVAKVRDLTASLDQKNALFAMAEEYLCTNCMKQCAKESPHFAWWVIGSGNWARQHAASENPAFNLTTGSGTLGLDYYGADGWVSGNLTYSRVGIDQSKDRGDSTVDFFTAEIHGTADLNDAFIELGALGTYNRYSNDRHIAFPGFEAHAKSHHTGWQGAAHLGLGYDFISTVVIEPYIAGDYVYIWQGSLTEQGAYPLNLHQNSSKSSMVQGEAALNMYIPQEMPAGLLLIRFTGRYLYRKGFHIGDITNSLIVGASPGLTVTAFNGSQNLFSPVVELFYRHDNGLAFSLLYNGEFGKEYRSNGVVGRLGCYF